MIELNLSMAEYRALPRLSKHELDNFSVAPAYYKFRKTKEWKPSRQMELGTLVHSHALEGVIDYALGPVVDRRTKAGKEEWELFCQENIGKMILTQDEYAAVTGAVESVRPFLERVQDAGPISRAVEASMFWKRDGVECKGRPDLIGSMDGSTPVIFDLKTTTDIRWFDSKFFSLRYDVQAAWYADGLKTCLGLDKLPTFCFLVVDMEPPHLAQFVIASTDVVEQANERIDEELELYKQCKENDTWPGLPSTRIILPRSM